MAKEELDFLRDPRFSILRVCSLVNVEIRMIRGKFDGLGTCPFCGRVDHFYISTELNSYKCQRCGEGGSATELYAQARNISNGDAVKELKGADVNSKEIKLIADKQRQYASERGKACEQKAPIEIRDKIFNMFLDMLTLKAYHHKNLIERGLTYEDIVKAKYKSLPDDEKIRRGITSNLLNQIKRAGIPISELKGIPGFYKDAKGWTFYYKQGYFIPCRDVIGRIIGGQIRLDNPPVNEHGKIKNKYRWFSAGSIKEALVGTTSGSPIHVAGLDLEGLYKGKRPKRIFIIEGILKADVAIKLMNLILDAPLGENVALGIPGTGVFKHIEIYIKHLNPEKILTAYDMDKKTNPQVLKDENKLREHLQSYGYFSTTMEDWPSELGKGLDDYLLNAYKEARGYSFNQKNVQNM